MRIYEKMLDVDIGINQERVMRYLRAKLHVIE